MKRKDFLKAVAFMPIVANTSFAEEKTSGVDSLIPTWVDVEIDKAKQRIDAWRKNRNCALFVFITDLHSGINGVGSDKTEHVRYANRAAEKFGANAILNLGDWGLEFPVKREHDGEALFNTILKKHFETKVPTYFCVGNHDHYYARYSSAFLGWKYLHKNATLSKDGDYGYVDFPKQKCRMFFLNSSDEAYYGMGDAQIEFLKEALAKIPKDFAAVIFTHYCADELGAWRNSRSQKMKNKKAFRK